MASDPVVGQLRPDQVQEITTAFMEFDCNRHGYITAPEMKECLRRSQIQFQDVEVDRVVSNMDSNRDGTVSYDEYMKFMARVYTGHYDQFQRTPGPAPGVNPFSGPSNQPYNPGQPAYNPSQPGYNPSQPGYNPSQPAYNPNQPSYGQPQYNPQQGGQYPPGGQQSPRLGGQYPPPQGGQYPPPQGGQYPPPQGGAYPPPQGNYPPAQGYNQNQPSSNYPPRQY